MTETTFTKTKHSINTESSSDNYSSVLTVKKDELISTSQPFTDKECYLDMRNSSFEYAMFYKDEEGLRQGKIKRKERNCFEVPANEIRYIVFKSAMQWGWISFEITEENRITIKDVALSKK